MKSRPGDKDCVFCKIVAGEIASNLLYEDEDIIAFRDIKPITPTHLLIVSRKHIPSLALMKDTETPLIGKMTRVANQLAREHGVADTGYRLVINSGADAGQLVPHLHMHLLAGRGLKWNH